MSKKPVEFYCRTKYFNTLPSVPVEPKILELPVDKKRHIDYRLTQLEKEAKFDLVLFPSLSIDLVDTSRYKTCSDQDIHKADLDLAIQTIDFGEDGSKHLEKGLRPSASWLRRTESNLKRFKPAHTDKTVVLEKPSAPTGADLQSLKHSKNPWLTVKKVLPIVPDVDSNSPPLAMVMFDGPPPSSCENEPVKEFIVEKSTGPEKTLLYHYGPERSEQTYFPQAKEYFYTTKRESSDFSVLCMMPHQAVYHAIDSRFILRTRRISGSDNHSGIWIERQA